MPIRTPHNPLGRGITDWVSHLPISWRIISILLFELAVFYFDGATGPLISASLFYLLNIFLALRFVGSWFGYAMAWVSSLGKVQLASNHWPDNLHFGVIAWEAFTTLLLYLLLCYLLNSQITRWRRTAQALDELSTLHSSIISETESGILLFDAHGTCLLANQAAARITGCSPEEMRQYNFVSDHSVMSIKLRSIAPLVMQDGEPQHIDSPLHTPFGRDIWCIASIRRIIHNSAPCLLVVFTDTADYKYTQQALHAAYAETNEAKHRATLAERSIVNISEATQQKIGQELHDNLGQHLTGVAFLSEVLFQKLKSGGYADMETPGRITQLINEAIAKTRKLAHGLYPVELKESGLVTMLEKLADNVRTIYGVECQVSAPENWHSDAEESIHLFRIAQEAINNAIRHGDASCITLHLTQSPHGRTLEISDNGIGMQETQQTSGIGLKTMQHRASLLDAHLTISQPAVGGTSLLIKLPEHPAYA